MSQGLEVLEKVDEVIGGHVGVVPDGNMLQCGCTPKNFKSIFKDISLLVTFSLMPGKILGNGIAGIFWSQNWPVWEIIF